MNLKLNNESRNTVGLQRKKTTSAIKEERRRTGRYIAILVGISLLLLAIYHAWVRRIPVVASLVVPALIMFIYVAWVLYSASRDKYKALDLEAALRATNGTSSEDISPVGTTNNIEISIISEDIGNREDPPKHPAPIKQNAKLSRVAMNTKQERNLTELTNNGHLVKPIILINDKPPDEVDGVVTDFSKTAAIHLERNIVLSEKIRAKRRFFTNKKRNVYKRSYSIA